MPGWDGNGSVTVTYDFTDDAAADIDPAASRFDQNFSDVISALENCMTLDGQTTPTADVTMGSFKITNLATGVSDNDAVNVAQLNAAISDYTIYVSNQVFG